MPFTYQIRLNGEPIFATLGATVIDKLEEPLDEGALHIPITVKDVEYEMLGLLDIQVSKTGQTTKRFTYVILSDKVQVKSKAGYYSHDLQAVEYTYKFDKYLINALTFTKPFEKKVRAPFEWASVAPTNNYTYAPYYLYEDIYINETYFINKEYLFTQVSQMDVLDYSKSPLDLTKFVKRDIYIQFDGGTPLNLTTSDRTHTFTTKGFKDIVIGWYDDLNDFVPILTYHIAVINERRYTLWDMLELVRATVPIESKFYHTYYNTRLFDIDTNYETVFKKIEMPQMFFQKQTLRQILNTMFKYINAISRLQYDETNYDTLTVDEFNKITGSFNLLGIVDYSSEQNAQNYASIAVSYLEKSLQTNFRENASVISPSSNSFKTVRATNIQLTQSGGGFNLPLEYEMYEPTKITVTIPYVAFERVSYYQVEQDYELDLTSRFLNKDFWNLKDFTVDFPEYTELQPSTQYIGERRNKNGNFFWERNTKKIDLSYAVGTEIKENLIINVIQEALHEEVTRKKFIFDAPNDDLSADKVTIEDIETTFNSQTSTTDLLFRNLKFNVEYITFGNPTVKIERENTENFKYYSELRVNQQARITDFSRATRDAYGQIQRAGVPNINFSKRHFDLDDILDIGMIDSNGYIITHRSLQFQNEFINARYQATKNHNRLNEYNGIDQEYRVFENPQLGYNRVDYYNDYVFIDDLYNTEDPTLNIQPTFLKNTSIPKLFSNLRNYDAENDNYKITYAMVRTDGFLENYPDGTYEHAIMIPVQSFGGKGTLVFEFGFDNNLYAGNAIYRQTLNTGGIDTYYNEPILYGDTQGFFDEIWFAMGGLSGATTPFDDIGNAGEDYFNDGYKYPLVRSSSFESTQGFEIQTGDINPTYATHNPIIAYKDASSNYYVSYGIIIKSKVYEKYIIGNHFFIQNSLVNKIANDFDVYLYKYTDGTKYRIFDDYTLKDGTYDTPVLLSTGNTSVSSTTGKFEFLGSAIINPLIHTSWAIADENGNLFMACNEPNNGFKAVLRHYNSDLMGIGNKLFTSSVFNFYDETANLDFQMSTTVDVILINDSFTVTTNMEYTIDEVLGDDYWETANIDYSMSTTVDLISINDSFEVTTNMNYEILPILGDDYWEEPQVTYNLTPSVDIHSINDSINVTTNMTYNISPVLGIDGWETATVDYNITVTAPISDYGSLNVATNMNYDISIYRLDYQWFPVSGQTPTVNQTCDLSYDELNVRCDTATPSACSWDTVGGQYTSSTDQSENVSGSCFIVPSAKTECAFLAGQWYCQDYVAVITDYDYSDCFICTAVEVVE